MIDLSEQTGDYLDSLQRAVIRERAIRSAMETTGESREVVAEGLDALISMDQEAILDLTEGHPTTLVDALTRYIEILTGWNHLLPRDQVIDDLSAILDYPWGDPEADCETFTGVAWCGNAPPATAPDDVPMAGGSHD